MAFKSKNKTGKDEESKEADWCDFVDIKNADSLTPAQLLEKELEKAENHLTTNEGLRQRTQTNLTGLKQAFAL